MTRIVNPWIFGGFALGVTLIVGNGYVSYRNVSTLTENYDRVIHSERVLRLLDDALVSAIDAETGQRGYIITGEERYLDPYHAARASMIPRIDELQALVVDNPDQLAQARRLRALALQRLEELERTIGVRRELGDIGGAVNMVSGDAGKIIMDRFRAGVAAMEKTEELLLAARATEAHASARLATATLLLSGALSLGLLVAVLVIGVRAAARQQKVMSEQAESNRRLAVSLAEVSARNQQVQLLTQLSSFLQSCASSQEACEAVASLGPRLLPGVDGRLFLYHPSRNHLTLAATWGAEYAGEALLMPEDCWGLRRGRVHEYRAAGEIACRHVQTEPASAAAYACIPMMAQGETLGLLHLSVARESDSSASPVEAGQRLAAAVAEQAALALANLRLRETLRLQSIRDALTGLYNRRFLEESFDRELARMERLQCPLSVLMADIDHFKRFNDTHGHEAGDVVLRDVGRMLREQSRRSDVACRLGGEEFVLLLPDTPLDIAVQRAEKLREAVAALKLVHDGRPLGELTVSLGVAVFPEHGDDRVNLLHAADLALYEAKRAGRNRVVISTGSGRLPATA